jgi:hypothetical protein
MVECSPAIVAQINLVNNFTGGGVVKSFYVPYFCPECDEEKVLLVEASDMGPPPHEPPTCRCDECDLVMDFDDMPDSYFAFLSHQRKVAEPEKVSSAMRALGAGAGNDKGKIRARAVGTPSMSSHKSSLPSVPSLPSIKGSTGSKPGSQPGSNPGSNPGSRPGKNNGKPGSRPSFGQMPQLGGGAMAMMDRPAMAQPRSNAVIYVLVTILLAAIGVLTYLLLTR